MTKVPQSAEDLRRHLSEQVGFLESSCAGFDRGNEAEAKRIAASLRILLHDTDSSKSLLGQLGMLGGMFLDTAQPPIAGSLISHNGLAFVEVADRVRYIAM